MAKLQSAVVENAWVQIDEGRATCTAPLSQPAVPVFRNLPS